MKSLALLVSLFAASICAQAATITGGTITLPGFGDGEFHLTGPGIDLRGNIPLDDVAWDCHLCGPGEPITITPTIGSNDAALNGISLLGVRFDIAYPEFTHGGQKSVTVPFWMSGQAVFDPPAPGNIVALSGWGHIVLTLDVYDPSFGYPPGTAAVQSAVLIFEPVPEPATALLLIPGLALLVARKRFSSRRA